MSARDTCPLCHDLLPTYPTYVNKPGSCHCGYCQWRFAVGGDGLPYVTKQEPLAAQLERQRIVRFLSNVWATATYGSSEVFARAIQAVEENALSDPERVAHPEHEKPSRPLGAITPMDRIGDLEYRLKGLEDRMGRAILPVRQIADLGDRLRRLEEKTRVTMPMSRMDTLEEKVHKLEARVNNIQLWGT